MTADQPVWPDFRARRLIDKSALEHAAQTLNSSYPAHIWPRPDEGTRRSLDPAALQAGFVEGVRFAIDALYGMANEAGDDADTVESETVS